MNNISFYVLMMILLAGCCILFGIGVSDDTLQQSYRIMCEVTGFIGMCGCGYGMYKRNKDNENNKDDQS